MSSRSFEVIELNHLNRNCIPEEISELSGEDELNFVVGIGGHHAPPNIRLFSYVLPAIELAQINGNGRHSLTLSTSANAALRYNYPNEGISKLNQVYWHTREKIALIFAFIQEFFPDVFSRTESYYGDIQNTISEAVWIRIWDEIAQSRSDVCNAFLRGIGKKECHETKAYAVRHAFWFLDFIFAGDSEFTGNIHAATVSVGSEKEALFNSIRREISALPLDFLREVLDPTLLRREKIFQLIFPTGNPVPYGEKLKGKKGEEKSAEVELLTRQPPFSFPLSLHGKLSEDVEYTLNKLEELAGVSGKDFLKFLNSLKS